MNTSDRIRAVRNNKILTPVELGRLYLTLFVEENKNTAPNQDGVDGSKIDRDWFHKQVSRLDVTNGLGVYTRYLSLSSWIISVGFRQVICRQRFLAIAKGIETEMQVNLAVIQTMQMFQDCVSDEGLSLGTVNMDKLEDLGSYWFIKFANNKEMQTYLDNDYKSLADTYKEMKTYETLFHILAVKLEIPVLEKMGEKEAIKELDMHWDALQTLKDTIKEGLQTLPFVTPEEQETLVKQADKVFPDFQIYKTIRIYRPYGTKTRKLLDLELSQFKEGDFEILLETLEGK